MLKTCFGCCPLRNGVSAIAIINMILNLMELIFHGNQRDRLYNKYTWVDVEEKINGTIFSSYEDKMPVITGIFMDYIFILNVGWIVLEIISNINLKQSTFKPAPHKIYVWLTVYYANLLFMIIHSIHSISIIIKHSIPISDLTTEVCKVFGYIYFKLLYILIILFEISIIHSYYIVEHNEMLNTFVQIKWKYISKGKVESEGVDITSTSAFMTSTSGQTKERSKIPPYITNVIQD